MELVDGGAVELRVPEGGGGPAVLVKNLYLSCDPYMRGRMRDFRNSYIPPFKPGSVSFPRFPFHFFGGACPLGLFWLAAEAAGCKVGWAIRALIEQFLDLCSLLKGLAWGGWSTPLIQDSVPVTLFPG